MVYFSSLWTTFFPEIIQISRCYCCCFVSFFSLFSFVVYLRSVVAMTFESSRGFSNESVTYACINASTRLTCTCKRWLPALILLPYFLKISSYPPNCLGSDRFRLKCQKQRENYFALNNFEEHHLQCRSPCLTPSTQD